MKALFRSPVSFGFAALLSLLPLGSAQAYENTILIRVSPERLWQCGDGFFSHGGHERYRYARVFVNGRHVASYDFADAGDCAKVTEEMVDLPDGGRAEVEVEVEGHRMGAAVLGRDRNRIHTIGFFVDHANGALTQDYAPPRRAAAAAEEAPPAAGLWRNTIDIRVSEERLWQCGDRFFASGGSETYRFATLFVDGREVAHFDLALQADCSRVITVTRDLPDGGRANVVVEVGGNRMGADVLARDRPRRHLVSFFVDHINGRLTQDGP